MENEPKLPVTPVIAPAEGVTSAEASHQLPERLVGGVAATGAEVDRPVADTVGALPIGDLAPAEKPYTDTAAGLGMLGSQGVGRGAALAQTQTKPYEGHVLVPGADGPEPAAHEPESKVVPGTVGLPGVGTPIAPWAERTAPTAKPRISVIGDAPEQE